VSYTPVTDGAESIGKLFNEDGLVPASLAREMERLLFEIRMICRAETATYDHGCTGKVIDIEAAIGKWEKSRIVEDTANAHGHFRDRSEAEGT
jgi:hypothetical protein